MMSYTDLFDLNLEELYRKRSKSVQQQNTLKYIRVLKGALYYRLYSDDIPEIMQAYLRSHGVDLERSIILEFGFDEIHNRFFSEGTLLTQDQCFVSFEVELAEDLRSIESECYWRDVTKEQNVMLRNRGVGIGEGALALKIQDELNKMLKSEQLRVARLLNITNH